MEFSEQVREYVKKEFGGDIIAFQTKYELKTIDALVILSGKNSRNIDKKAHKTIKEDMNEILGISSQL